MSTIYDKTDNYSLNLYGDNDPADLRDGYNRSMHTIDDTLKNHLDRIEKAEAAETHDREVVKALIGDNTVDAATTAKAKWDEPVIVHDDSLRGNGTSANPLKVSLGSESVADATDAAVYPKLTKDKTTGNINGIAFNVGNGLTAYNSDDPTIGSGVRLSESLMHRIELLEGIAENIIVVGDSISYGTGPSSPSKSWANMLSDYRGCTVTNLALNNAGYVATPTFLSQLQGYVGDRSAVTRIIIAGGANDKDFVDGTDESSNLTTAIGATLDYARNNFPNAKIQVIPCLLGFKPASLYHENIWTVIRRIQQVCGRKGIQCIPYGWEWLAGNDAWTADFKIHPNDEGSLVLLKNIANAIDGGVYRAEWSGTLTPESNYCEIHNQEFRVSGGVLSCMGQVKILNNPPAYATFVRMPYAAMMAHNYPIVNSSKTFLYMSPTEDYHYAHIGPTEVLVNESELYFSFSKVVDS